jgi:hypothetical protein
MPKSVAEVVENLNEMLRKSGNPVATIPWPKFYEANSADRLKQPRLDAIIDEAKSRFQLIVAYGSNVVVVAHDRNFSSQDI